jgi:glycosyltransferase involved in cell wall biosynthesis
MKDPSSSVALVHDYLTQRGGAERVVLALCEAFPGAPLYTSLYDPDGTFPEFRDVDVHTLPLNTVPAFRQNHRLAFPFLAPSFSALRLDHDVVICSSSGWAHGARATGRKIVYCHTPARWLYQSDRYLGVRGGDTGFDWRHAVRTGSLEALRRPLRTWDLQAARSADRYLANSHHVASQILDAYGIDAAVVPPPPVIDPHGPKEHLPGLAPGFLLCVSRLLPYKNVDAVMAAMRSLPEATLVVVGDGPQAVPPELRATRNVTRLRRVTDDQLRWLYANAFALVSASYEDFGLTPLEAAMHGTPSVLLRAGGFLDTTVEGVTGMFFANPSPADIAGAISHALRVRWDPALIQAHAQTFSKERFIAAITDLTGGPSIHV